MKFNTMLVFIIVWFCSISMVMCGNDNNDDDDDDNDNNDDDDSSGADFFEGADCTGYDYPECGTSVDVPPQLLSVTIFVNETEVEQPLTIHLNDEVALAIEFTFPGDNNRMCDGHIFLVRDSEELCLDASTGLPGEGPYPLGVSGICSTEAAGGPFTFKIEPSNFLNNEGAPYYLEISNACATHSNRLPLDIVTVAE